MYLQFASSKPVEYSESDRRVIAGALLEGARGLGDGGDPVLAVSLAERAVVFGATAAGWMLVGQLHQHLGMAAAAAFEQAITLEPSNPAALIARADLALAESDWLLAQQLYQRVPADHAEHARARKGLEKARAVQQEQTQRLAVLHKAERELAAGPGAAPGGGVRKASGPLTNRQVCLALTTGMCGATRRCALARGLPDPTTGCGLLALKCPVDKSPARVTGTELEACLVGLKALDCRKLESSKALRPGDAAAQCRVIERAYGQDSDD